ncbi:MAG: IS1 family transposase [Symbiopectobacterium sp.]
MWSFVGKRCGHLLATKTTALAVVCMGAVFEADYRSCIWLSLPMLLRLFSGYRVAFWCTDGYRAYNDELPKAKHIVGKLYTQRVERENLTLRNRLKCLNRKTLGYSISSEMHDRLIGTYIERDVLRLMLSQLIEYKTLFLLFLIIGTEDGT